jgi:hypothetical protein
VHLVAHGEGLRHQGSEVDRPFALEHRREGGRHHVANPRQPVERLPPVRPEAQLVTPGAIGDEGCRLGPVGRILDDEQGRARRDDARHRPHGATRVAGRERDVTAGGQSFGVFGRPRPALEEDRGLHRAAHGPAHPLPRDGRPGVQKRAAREVERLAGGADSRPRRARATESLQRLAIGSGDVGHGRPLY